MTTLVTTWWQHPSVGTISWTILWPLQWSQCTHIDIWMMMVVMVVMALMELGGGCPWRWCGDGWNPWYLCVGWWALTLVFGALAHVCGAHDDLDSKARTYPLWCGHGCLWKAPRFPKEPLLMLTKPIYLICWWSKFLENKRSSSPLFLLDVAKFRLLDVPLEKSLVTLETSFGDPLIW